LLQKDGSGNDGMVVGFGRDAARSAAKVVGRGDDEDARLIVAPADCNGLHNFLAASGGDGYALLRILTAHLISCTKISFRTSKHRCAGSIACREET
jgi:hypothetical protein